MEGDLLVTDHPKDDSSQRVPALRLGDDPRENILWRNNHGDVRIEGSQASGS